MSASATIHVRLPLEHLQELEQLAAQSDRSVSDEVRRAIRLYLKMCLQNVKIPA